MSQRKFFGLSACLAGAAMLFAASSAQALVVDPDTGRSGFNWWDGGVGASHVFTNPDIFDLGTALATGSPFLEITVTQDSYIDFSVLDCCIVGDTFALELDGSEVAWTTFGFGAPGGYFEATVMGLYLTAGLHTLDLRTLTQAFNTLDPSDVSGTADWSVSAATAVPLPAGLVLLLSALGGLGFVAKRRRADAVPA